MKSPTLRLTLPKVFFLSLGLLIVSCQTKKTAINLHIETPGVSNDSLKSQTVSLNLLESGSLKFDKSKKLTDQIGIEFAKVLNESRCPKDVNCVWAGNVEVALNLEVNEAKSTWRLLSIGAQSSPELEFKGYTFTLEDVSPYPQSNKTLEKGPYSVKIKVSPTATTNPPAQDPEKSNWN